MTKCTARPEALVALAAIPGLTFAECADFFNAKASKRDHKIAAMADTNDELEVDWSILSEGDDNGAWVLAWTWVSFVDTIFDKDELERRAFRPTG